MGQQCLQMCNKKKKRDTLLEGHTAEEQKIKETKFITYSSSLDSFFKPAEETYNLLKYFQMYEFLLLFSHMKIHSEYQIDGNIEKHNYLKEITKDEFLIFIDNKIMRNYLVISLINDNELHAAIFKDFMSELYHSTLFAVIDHFKRKNPGVKVKKGSIKSVKKIYIFVIPLLYCLSSDKAKMDFFFDLFSQGDKFAKSPELFDFLYYLFIIPSTCAFRACRNLGEKYPNKFDHVSNEDYLKNTDAFEVNDIMRLIDIFIDTFFKSNDFVQRYEYEQKFCLGDFGWIFSPKGIRAMLEKHNDVKENIDH